MGLRKINPNSKAKNKTEANPKLKKHRISEAEPEFDALHSCVSNPVQDCLHQILAKLTEGFCEQNLRKKILWHGVQRNMCRQYGAPKAITAKVDQKR